MNQTYHELLTRVERLSMQVHELRDEVRQAVTIAELDPQMSLMRRAGPWSSWSVRFSSGA